MDMIINLYVAFFINTMTCAGHIKFMEFEFN